MIQTDVYLERIKALRFKLSNECLDAFIIFTDSSRVHYSVFFSGILPSISEKYTIQIIYVTKDKLVLFLPNEDQKRVSEDSFIDELFEINYFFQFISSRAIHCKKIGVCGLDKIPHSFTKKVNEIFRNTIFEDYNTYLEEIRQIKNIQEIKCIKEASYLADKSLKYMKNRLTKTPCTEKELLAEGEYAVKTGGGEIAYDTVIASDLNTRYPTWRSSSQIITSGVLYINIIPKIHGYHSFCSTSLAINSKDVLHYCKLAGNVIKHILINIKCGDNISRIYKEYYLKSRELGILEYFLNFYQNRGTLGNGIGLDIKECPYPILQETSLVLKNNMVLCLKYGLTGFPFGNILYEFMISVQDDLVLLTKEVLEDILVEL